MTAVCLLVGMIQLAFAAVPPKPKPIDCGQSGIFWTKTYNVDHPDRNFLWAVDSTSLKVVYNWTWTNAYTFLYSAYDITTGLLVFYDAGYTLQYYDTKARKFADNQVTISLQSALDIWFDNQGTLWGLWFDPTNDKEWLFGTIDLGVGSVDPVWNAPHAENSMVDGSASLDWVNSVYYFNDGDKANHLMSMNLITGKFSYVLKPFVTTPVFLNNKASILGYSYSNGSLVTLNLETNKITVVIQKPEGEGGEYSSMYDAATNSYIIQGLDVNSETFYWWAVDITTQKTRQMKSGPIGVLGAHLCPKSLSLLKYIIFGM
jgi:hypothetical protein